MYNVYDVKHHDNTMKRRNDMININIKESKNCSEEYSMYVSFGYNQKIVDCIRNLPTRFWNKDTKEWENSEEQRIFQSLIFI